VLLQYFRLCRFQREHRKQTLSWDATHCNLSDLEVLFKLPSFNYFESLTSSNLSDIHVPLPADQTIYFFEQLIAVEQFSQYLSLLGFYSIEKLKTF
jgi:hypothetical protein